VKVVWNSPLSDGGPIGDYDVQFKPLDSLASNWTSVPESGVVGSNYEEIQVIENNGGSAFRLSLNFAGLNSFDSTSKTVTGPIPGDASAVELQEALQSLSNVGCVFVKKESFAAPFPHDDDRVPAPSPTWQVRFVRNNGTRSLLCSASNHASLSVATDFAQVDHRPDSTHAPGWPSDSSTSWGASTYGSTTSIGGTTAGHLQSTDVDGKAETGTLQGYNQNLLLPTSGLGLSVARFGWCESSSGFPDSFDGYYSSGDTGSDPHGDNFKYRCDYAFDGVMDDGPFSAWAVRDYGQGVTSGIGQWIHVKFAGGSMRLHQLRWKHRDDLFTNAAKVVRLDWGWHRHNSTAADAAGGAAGGSNINWESHGASQLITLRMEEGMQTHPLLAPVTTDAVRITIVEVYGSGLSNHNVIGGGGRGGSYTLEHNAGYSFGATEIQFIGVAQGWSGSQSVTHHANSSSALLATAARAALNGGHGGMRGGTGFGADADVPLLKAYGPNQQVRIWEKQKGTLGTAVCRTRAAQGMGSTSEELGSNRMGLGVEAVNRDGFECEKVVRGLMPHTMYQFRVRARAQLQRYGVDDDGADSATSTTSNTNLGAWSDYSAESDPVKMLLMAAPSSPAPPTLLSRSADGGLLLLVKAPWPNGLPVDSYELQFRALGAGGNFVNNADQQWQRVDMPFLADSASQRGATKSASPAAGGVDTGSGFLYDVGEVVQARFAGADAYTFARVMGASSTDFDAANADNGATVSVAFYQNTSSYPTTLDQLAASAGWVLGSGGDFVSSYESPQVGPNSDGSSSGGAFRQLNMASTDGRWHGADSDGSAAAANGNPPNHWNNSDFGTNPSSVTAEKSAYAAQSSQLLAGAGWITDGDANPHDGFDDLVGKMIDSTLDIHYWATISSKPVVVLIELGGVASRVHSVRIHWGWHGGYGEGHGAGGANVDQNTDGTGGNSTHPWGDGGAGAVMRDGAASRYDLHAGRGDQLAAHRQFKDKVCGVRGKGGTNSAQGHTYHGNKPTEYNTGSDDGGGDGGGSSASGRVDVVPGWEGTTDYVTLVLLQSCSDSGDYTEDGSYAISEVEVIVSNAAYSHARWHVGEDANGRDFPSGGPQVRENLALNMPATQSSVYDTAAYDAPAISTTGAIAGRAVDGSFDRRFASCTTTSLGETTPVFHMAEPPQFLRMGTTDPWWRVDLGSSQWIRGARITNRRGCCEERLTGFELWIGSVAEYWSSNQLCAAGKSIGDGETATIECVKKPIRSHVAQTSGMQSGSHEGNSRDNGNTAGNAYGGHVEHANAYPHEASYGVGAKLLAGSTTWNANANSEGPNNAPSSMQASSHQTGQEKHTGYLNHNYNRAYTENIGTGRRFGSSGDHPRHSNDGVGDDTPEAYWGRYFYVVLPGHKKILHLCEVEVLAANPVDAVRYDVMHASGIIETGVPGSLLRPVPKSTARSAASDSGGGGSSGMGGGGAGVGGGGGGGGHNNAWGYEGSGFSRPSEHAAGTFFASEYSHALTVPGSTFAPSNAFSVASSAYLFRVAAVNAIGRGPFSASSLPIAPLPASTKPSFSTFSESSQDNKNADANTAGGAAATGSRRLGEVSPLSIIDAANIIDLAVAGTAAEAVAGIRTTSTGIPSSAYAGFNSPSAAAVAAAKAAFAAGAANGYGSGSPGAMHASAATLLATPVGRSGGGGKDSGWEATNQGGGAPVPKAIPEQPASPPVVLVATNDSLTVGWDPAILISNSGPIVGYDLQIRPAGTKDRQRLEAAMAAEARFTYDLHSHGNDSGGDSYDHSDPQNDHTHQYGYTSTHDHTSGRHGTHEHEHHGGAAADADSTNQWATYTSSTVPSHLETGHSHRDPAELQPDRIHGVWAGLPGGAGDVTYTRVGNDPLGGHGYASTQAAEDHGALLFENGPANRNGGTGAGAVVGDGWVTINSETHLSGVLARNWRAEAGGGAGGTKGGMGSATGVGVGGVGSADLREIQTITTRLPPSSSGASITGGWFRVSFEAHGVNSFDSQTDTLTDYIRWDASAAEVQSALEALENVGSVQVRRVVLGRGQMQWVVTFDPAEGPWRRGAGTHGDYDPRREQRGAEGATHVADTGRYNEGPFDPLNRGDVPLLQAYSHGLELTGPQTSAEVITAEARRGQAHRVVCDASAGSPRYAGGGAMGGGDLSSDDASSPRLNISLNEGVTWALPSARHACTHTIAGLSSNTKYQIRLRAAAGGGWGPWSASSVASQTKEWRMPSAPIAPKLNSVTTSTITVSLALQPGGESADGSGGLGGMSSNGFANTASSYGSAGRAAGGAGERRDGFGMTGVPLTGGLPLSGWRVQARLRSALSSAAAAARDAAMAAAAARRGGGVAGAVAGADRSTDNGGTDLWFDVASVALPPGGVGGAGTGAGISNRGETIASASGLRDNAVYLFRSAAVNGAGVGAWSAPSAPMRTLLAVTDGPVSWGRVGPQEVVSGNMGRQAVGLHHQQQQRGGGGGGGGRSHNALSMRWEAADVAAEVEGYELQLRHDRDTAWTTVWVASGHVVNAPAQAHQSSSHAAQQQQRQQAQQQTFVSHTVAGLLEGSSYIFRVRAVNSAGAGTWSVVSQGVRTLRRKPAMKSKKTKRPTLSKKKALEADSAF
jgi:hypothetical protein